MIIFYPVNHMFSNPVVIADMTDSSDQWSDKEILAAILSNQPESVNVLGTYAVFSCKYAYEIRHNGTPLSDALRMTMSATVHSPPAGLIAQVSCGLVSSAQSLGELEAAADKIANPRFKLITAVVIERASISQSANICREFVAFSVMLQPDTYGASATLVVRAASFDDSIVRKSLAFELDTVLPLSVQLIKLAGSFGYTCVFDTEASSPPKCGRLFQPSTLPTVLTEICLQNKLLYTIKDGIIHIYSQTTPPLLIDSLFNYEFSFLGYKGNIMWGVGIENYVNVKFKTTLFDAKLFDKITVYDDNATALLTASGSSMFTGLKKAVARNQAAPPSYDLYILRYLMTRSDGELCCEVCATNNWLLSQVRVDGIFESKIYGV